MPKSRFGRKGHKEPLYRRENTRTHGVHHGGGAYRHSRHSKVEAESDARNGSMRSKQRHGLDYTPLFRFLLSKVGEDWSDTYSEAVTRLDRSEPIFWMVATSKKDGRPYVRIGESTYYSGLYVDENNRLARVDPNLTVDDMTPSCGCCTHTFNGKPFTRTFTAT